MHVGVVSHKTASFNRSCFYLSTPYLEKQERVLDSSFLLQQVLEVSKFLNLVFFLLLLLRSPFLFFFLILESSILERPRCA